MYYKSEFHPWKLACTLISLIHQGEKTSLDSEDSIVDYVESLNTSNASSREGGTFFKPGDPPTFYTMLLFYQVFCEYIFNDNSDFLIHNNCYLGSGTFVQLAHFMPEIVCVIIKQLSELKDGNWNQKNVILL